MLLFVTDDVVTGDCIKLFWQGVEDGGGITIFEKSHDLGDRRDNNVWWAVEPWVSEINFVGGNEEIGGDGCESGEEFLMLPIESDSAAEDTDSSAHNRVVPSGLDPIAWSAISEKNNNKLKLCMINEHDLSIWQDVINVLHLQILLLFI